MINTQSKCLSFIVELLKKSRIKNLNGHFDSNVMRYFRIHLFKSIDIQLYILEYTYLKVLIYRTNNLYQPVHYEIIFCKNNQKK
jgi:hypothetical protein